jgi:hypothetical protein
MLSAKFTRMVPIHAALTSAALLFLLLLAAHPAQAQTETVLYNFTGNGDGGLPWSRLTRDDKGNFYGTTRYGGIEYGCTGYGTVFELSPNDGGGWNETTLYNFALCRAVRTGRIPSLT